MNVRPGARASLDRSDDTGDDLVGLAKRRLVLIQKTLGLPDSYFEDRHTARPRAPGVAHDTDIAAALASEPGARLIEGFRRIEDPAVRDGILDLLFSLRDLSSSGVD